MDAVLKLNQRGAIHSTRIANDASSPTADT